MHHKLYTKGEGDEILQETHIMFIEDWKNKVPKHTKQQLTKPTTKDELFSTIGCNGKGESSRSINIAITQVYPKKYSLNVLNNFMD